MSDVFTTETANGLTVALYPEIKMLYPLTTCCKASAKGLEDCIGCRSCYREVDPGYGDALILNEDRDEAIQRISWWLLTLEELREVTPEEARVQGTRALDDLIKKAGWTTWPDAHQATS